MSNLTSVITIDPDGENIVSPEVAGDERHTLQVLVDRENGNVYLEFSSRQSLYDFARSLLHDALYGQGQKEFFPLLMDGKALVVDGARLTEGSSRMYVHYPSSSPKADGGN